MQLLFQTVVSLSEHVIFLIQLCDHGLVYFSFILTTLSAFVDEEMGLRFVEKQYVYIQLLTR